jgi:hypothetical protein
MDELRRFCVRMLGDGEAARGAEQAAHGAEGDRITALTAAAAACRRSAEQLDGADAVPAESSGPATGPDLAAAVAREVRAAAARLPERQREALALREMLALPYGEVGHVVGLEPAAVAALLARARLRLRAELRGTADPPGDCPERDRALRTIARRQDGESVAAADEDWLFEHLGHCEDCARAHAAMLEASACYRAWR